MTLDEGFKEAMRSVVREEIRAAMVDFSAPAADAPLTYAQAGSFLNCHANTIAEYVRRGLLPTTGAGRMTRVKRADLLMVLERLAGDPITTETPAETAGRILNSSKPRGKR